MGAAAQRVTRDELFPTGDAAGQQVWGLGPVSTIRGALQRSVTTSELGLWEPVSLQADARATDKETTPQLNTGPQGTRLVTSIQHRQVRELHPHRSSDGLEERPGSWCKERTGGGHTRALQQP